MFEYNNGFVHIQYRFTSNRWEFTVRSIKPNWVKHTDLYDLINYPQWKGITKLYAKVANYNKASYNWCKSFGGHIVIENNAYTIFMFDQQSAKVATARVAKLYKALTKSNKW